MKKKQLKKKSKLPYSKIKTKDKRREIEENQKKMVYMLIMYRPKQQPNRIPKSKTETVKNRKRSKN